MAKILFKYTGNRGAILADIIQPITKDTDLPQYIINSYTNYLEGIGVLDTKPVERFKQLKECDNPTYAEYLEVIEEHNLADEQARELYCINGWIGYYYTSKETDKEKTKRIHQYSVNNFCFYIHYLCHSLSDGAGSDRYIGGTQHQLHDDIESAFKNDKVTTCKVLMAEYIKRRYNLAGITE